MKGIIQGALLALAVGSVEASVLANGPLDEVLFHSEVQENETYFETLGKLYKAGRLPELKKIKNIAWAGRCFTKTEQSKPINGGYIFRVKKGEDVGPLGRDKVSYEAATYWDPYKATSYFDTMSLNDVYKAVTNLKFFNVSLKSDSIVIAHVPDSISSLKLSGEYLVEEISSALPGNDVGPLGGESKRSIDIRCYYFIPELANQ